MKGQLKLITITLIKIEVFSKKSDNTMGNADVKWNKGRKGGGNEVGTEVISPLEFMKLLFGDQDAWNQTIRLVTEVQFVLMPSDKQSRMSSWRFSDLLTSLETSRLPVCGLLSTRKKRQCLRKR